MKFRWGVKILPREVILDTQGRAIEQTLRLNQMSVEHCRVGKYVELEIEGSEEQTQKRANEIAKKLLHNPLIETYLIEKL